MPATLPGPAALARSRSAALPALLLAALASAPAPAAEPPSGRPHPDGVDPGTGCLQTIVDGRTVDFPLKHTKVDAKVSGPVARVEVTQTFQNPYRETIEATYVFPLPHEAAVSDFRMRIGDRTVLGVIEKRGEARRIYEQALASGRVASLLEQERPNVFTQSVANILPGREIDVTITYVETLPYANGRWELVFPTVVGPRFHPPPGAGPGDLVPASADRPGIPARDRVDPPFLPPGTRSGHDLSIDVEWDAGIPIDAIESPTHRIDVTRRGGHSAAVALHPLDSVPDKDFVLQCRAKGDGPATGVLAYHDGRDGYLTVLLHPKLDLGRGDVTPKEMIFVLDSSGSMRGEPIAAAKAVVRHALTRVNPGDTFQMINFESTTSSLGPEPVPATPENVKRGLAYLERLEGEGGTMMIEGIRAALDFPRDPSRLRVVMFLTDGYIGNESEILAAVRERVGDARLYAFGVGSSVNRYLLDGLAEEGRGEVHYVLPGTSAMDAAAAFAERIRDPYLTDVELVWRGAAVEDESPARPPDLFGGKPLAIHARYAGGGDASLEVRGRIGGRAWSQRVPLDLPKRRAGNEAIGALWARARIADLEREAHVGTTPEIQDEITQLGLGHRLVTRFTSFVAVEERTVVSDGRPTRVRVPFEMPQGVSWEGVFGGRKDAAGSTRGVSLGGPGGTRQMPFAGEIKSRAITTTRESDASRSGVPPLAVRLPEGRGDSRSSRDGGAPAPSLALRLAAERAVIEAGTSLVLTLTIENAGAAAVEVPKELRLGDGLVRLVVKDAAGSETFLGVAAGPPGGAPSGASPAVVPSSTVSLAAGKTRTYRIRVAPQDAAFLLSPGTYDVLVRGGPLGTGHDSNTLVVRVKS